jgi:hypothetical protein
MPPGKKLLPKIAIMIFMAIAALFFPSVLFADGDLPPALNADCTVDIIGEPKINEPFEVIFSFAPNQDLIHTKNIPDTAKIGVDEKINFVSGDTLRTGFMEKGRTYVLRAYLMVRDSIRFRIRGKVIAMQAMGLFISVSDIPDPGVKARTGASSEIIDFTGRPENVIILDKPIINPEDSTVLYFVKDTIPLSFFFKPIRIHRYPVDSSEMPTEPKTVHMNTERR